MLERTRIIATDGLQATEFVPTREQLNIPDDALMCGIPHHSQVPFDTLPATTQTALNVLIAQLKTRKEITPKLDAPMAYTYEPDVYLYGAVPETYDLKNRITAYRVHLVALIASQYQSGTHGDAEYYYFAYVQTVLDVEQTLALFVPLYMNHHHAGRFTAAQMYDKRNALLCEHGLDNKTLEQARKNLLRNHRLDPESVAQRQNALLEQHALDTASTKRQWDELSARMQTRAHDLAQTELNPLRTFLEPLKK
jgi:hypothetical protein